MLAMIRPAEPHWPRPTMRGARARAGAARHERPRFRGSARECEREPGEGGKGNELDGCCNLYMEDPDE